MACVLVDSRSGAAATAHLNSRNNIPAAKQSQILRLARRRTNPYVKNFWLTMRRLQFRPVATQVAVRHSQLRLGTMADVVVKDTSNRYRVIEIKTGFSNYNRLCTPWKMNAPFAQRNDCAFHQHHLQLAATNAMYKMTYRQSQMAAPMLIRFDSDDIYCTELLVWLRSSNVMQDLFNSINSQCL